MIRSTSCTMSLKKRFLALSWPLHAIIFFFNDTATTEIYTLSLHDALPIFARRARIDVLVNNVGHYLRSVPFSESGRSEEHTSELQSPCNLVCRLLLEKKKTYANQKALTQMQLIKQQAREQIKNDARKEIVG